MSEEVSPEDLEWAGLNVANWSVHAIDLSGLLSIPARRGENFVVAGRDGTRRVPRKNYDGREFGIDFWIRGCDADGRVPPKGQAAAFYDSIDFLASLAVQDVAPLVHTLPDGTRRHLDVEVMNAIDPSRWLAGMLARVRVVFTSSSSWWRGLEDITVERTLRNGEAFDVEELAGCNGRISDARVRFGPGNNPLLTQELPQDRPGPFIGWDGVIGAGQSVALGDYRHTMTGGLPWDRRRLRRDRRQGAWFVIDPMPGLAAPRFRLNHTGSGSMNVALTARPSWAVG